MNDSIAIVIPIYKCTLTDLEVNTVKNNILKLNNNHKIFIIGPDLIRTTQFNPIIDSLDRIYFDEMFFSSLEGYNKLLRSSQFYSAFQNYKYILVVQTDAFVFENNLNKFIQKNYDYWGAPWIDFELINYKFLKPVLPIFHKSRHLWPLRNIFGPKYLVGNGGLSLRNVSTHYFITEKYSDYIEQFESKHDTWINNGALSMMEDVFWCLFVPKIYPKYKIAPWKEALSFSFEMNPRKAFLLNKNKLPFGCHAFNKIDFSFYSDIIKL